MAKTGTRCAWLALTALLMTGAPPACAAPSNSDCLDCHSDKDLTMTKGGAEISAAVDPKTYAASVHADLDCTDCHAEFSGVELPHDDLKVKPVDCTGCHDDVAKVEKESLHGLALARGDALAPRCQTCHGSHGILPVRDRGSAVSPIRVPFVCGQCHREGAPVQLQREISQDHILENYTESIHGEGLLKNGLVVAATCASCHTAHQILPHTDPRSSINRTNIAAMCSTCHAEIERVHRKVIEGHLWQEQPHVLPACVDCHQPHKARRVFYEQGMADKDCLSCHAQPDLQASRDGRPLFVDAAEAAGSIHAKVSCAQCHSQVDASHERPCDAITAPVNCASCHAEAGDQYAASIHGTLKAKGDGNAPTCVACHGTHAVLGRADARSPVFPTNIPDLCSRCHLGGGTAAVRYQGDEHDIIDRYRESIHGKGLLKSGLTVTATCTDCHGGHGELPASDPRSTVHRANIASTCAQCHHGIHEQFERSIHAPAVAKEAKPEALPVCSDCHSAHSITRTDDNAFQLETMERCGKCHAEIAETYFDTYHGKVSRLGYTKTAKCYDCHGAHDVLPSSDPASHLSRENVVATCQKCHPQATRRFAGYLTHATHHDPHKYPWLFYTFWAMTGLLVVTFSVSGMHTILWLPRTLEMRRRHRRDLTAAPKGALQYVRFSRFHRLSHVVMIVSFMSLALTGLTLKFSYTPWAVVMARFFGGFESAGYIHRVAAVFMFALFAAHLCDLAVYKRPKYGSWRNLVFGPDALMFNKRDGREFVQSIRWFLGLGERPHYGRWTYWEKFDYFAVFWGILVIGSTGLMLWFPEFFTRVLPGWLINVATIVHSDEALLAAGFIFTIHFFNTHLRPEKFPMDTVIFTGRMDLEELKIDKPEEYERLRASGELEKRLAEPMPDIVVKVIRIFAWTALAIGTGTVIWIILAMLFAYR
jgi:cytochrome b subunit of formate dehydrogenase